MVAALIPLAIVIDITLLLVSYPSALEIILVTNVPIFALAFGGAFLSFRRTQRAIERASTTPQESPLEKLKERNTGRRAPTESDTTPISEEEEEEADVFLGETEAAKSERQVNLFLQSLKAKEMDLGSGPMPGFEARPQSVIVEPTVANPQPVEQPAPKPPPTEEKSKSKKKYKDYELSPEKLKVPAFICRCGHPHRFVCLQCGTTAENAIKNKKMHWIEWVPEMGATS